MLASYYLGLKHLHISAVTLSFILFALRGVWMLGDSPQLQRRWVRILPHVVDTVLLASAISLTLILHQYPFLNDWLTAKTLALIVYIILGHLALKRAATKFRRAIAGLAALLVFGYIVSVAWTRHPLGVFALVWPMAS